STRSEVVKRRLHLEHARRRRIMLLSLLSRESMTRLSVSWQKGHFMASREDQTLRIEDSTPQFAIFYPLSSSMIIQSQSSASFREADADRPGTSCRARRPHRQLSGAWLHRPHALTRAR